VYVVQLVFNTTVQFTRLYLNRTTWGFTRSSNLPTYQ